MLFYHVDVLLKNATERESRRLYHKTHYDSKVHCVCNGICKIRGRHQVDGSYRRLSFRVERIIFHVTSLSNSAHICANSTLDLFGFDDDDLFISTTNDQISVKM
jgi:hypothetical protein